MLALWHQVIGPLKAIMRAADEQIGRSGPNRVMIDDKIPDAAVQARLQSEELPADVAENIVLNQDVAGNLDDRGVVRAKEVESMCRVLEDVMRVADVTICHSCTTAQL